AVSQYREFSKLPRLKRNPAIGECTAKVCFPIAFYAVNPDLLASKVELFGLQRNRNIVSQRNILVADNINLRAVIRVDPIGTTKIQGVVQCVGREGNVKVVAVVFVLHRWRDTRSEIRDVAFIVYNYRVGQHLPKVDQVYDTGIVAISRLNLHN